MSAEALRTILAAGLALGVAVTAHAADLSALVTPQPRQATQFVCYTRLHVTVAGITGTLLQKRSCDPGEKSGTIRDASVTVKPYSPLP